MRARVLAVCAVACCILHATPPLGGHNGVIAVITGAGTFTRNIRVAGACRSTACRMVARHIASPLLRCSCRQCGRMRRRLPPLVSACVRAESASTCTPSDNALAFSHSAPSCTEIKASTDTSDRRKGCGCAAGQCVLGRRGGVAGVAGLAGLAGASLALSRTCMRRLSMKSESPRVRLVMK